MNNSKAFFNLTTNCPKCGAEQPVFRIPKDWRQLLFGGWTCKKCGCRMDRQGNKIAAKK
jgi:transposase-like protein